jgi:hypothetical protein
MTGFYRIKIIDFGTEKIYEQNKSENKIIGSSYYIALHLKFYIKITMKNVIFGQLELFYISYYVGELHLQVIIIMKYYLKLK